MAYTATKYISPRVNPYPRGKDNTQRMVYLFGSLVENDTSTEYSVGGIGSSAFEVTAFSNVGLVTYSALVGQALVNGQRVVIYNTASNTNDGTYIVSQLTPSSTTAGTFVAVPLPGKALAGSSQTSQTAEGVGQIQWANRSQISQTFTATAVAVSGSTMTVTYTTLVGPQLWPGDKVILTGMTNAGNNGTFSLNLVIPTSSTGGSFQVTNAAAVATDSGSGTGKFNPGSDDPAAAGVPVEVEIGTTKGYVYQWDPTNYTIRIFLTGTSANTVLNEAAVGANVAFDGTITFVATFPRSVSNQFD